MLCIMRHLVCLRQIGGQHSRPVIVLSYKSMYSHSKKSELVFGLET